MRLVHLTAGTGSFFCGTCLRDHALVKALRRLGHDALMVPLYLPLVLDDSGSREESPLFFGGINVYLQQKSAFFRHTPQWFDKLLDSPALLRQAGRKAGMTNPRELGEMTLSMIKGEHGHQAKELDKLVAWLVEQKPDVVCLSNSLLIGVARRVREELRVPIICSLQGEDAFLDSLPEPYRERCWQLVRERAADVDRFVAPSRYYNALMQERLRLAPEKIVVIYNGIDLDGFAPAAAPPEFPTVGFLARMCRDKGLDTLVEAFIKLAPRVPHARLKIGGTQTDADRAFVNDLTDRLGQAGIANAVKFLPNLTPRRKAAVSARTDRSVGAHAARRSFRIVRDRIARLRGARRAAQQRRVSGTDRAHRRRCPLRSGRRQLARRCSRKIAPRSCTRGRARPLRP